jgi:hypothetical protein
MGLDGGKGLEEKNARSPSSSFSFFKYIFYFFFFFHFFIIFMVFFYSLLFNFPLFSLFLARQS